MASFSNFFFIWHQKVLDAYLIYMTKVAELMGGTNVDDQMKEVLEFEKRLAAVSCYLLLVHY